MLPLATFSYEYAVCYFLLLFGLLHFPLATRYYALVRTVGIAAGSSWRGEPFHQPPGTAAYHTHRSLKHRQTDKTGAQR